MFGGGVHRRHEAGGLARDGGDVDYGLWGRGRGGEEMGYSELGGADRVCEVYTQGFVVCEVDGRRMARGVPKVRPGLV